MCDMRERLCSVPGRVGFYYKNMATGEVESYHADQCFQAASVIKLPILAAVGLRAEQEPELLKERVLVRDADKLPGCGALQHITWDQTYDIETLCRLMITISDNTATNALIRRFGMEELNGDFLRLGLEKTHIYRLLFDSEAAERGLENLFCPEEVAGLLEKIHRKECVSQTASEWMLSILLQQQINHKIPGRLPPEFPVAHKTGEDDGITNDVGIVYGREPVVLVFASNETDVPSFNQVIRDLSFHYCVERK